MNTPTLAAAAKEFKINPDEITAFLAGKGFGLNTLQTEAELTSEMYAAAEGRFAEDLAIRRIKQCLDTQNTYLEIGRCGLTDNDFEQGSELDSLLKQCTQLKTLILSNAWWNFDEKKWDQSSNNRRGNKFSQLPPVISSCKKLEKLICSGFNDLPQDHWKIQDIDILSELLGLKYIDLSINQIRNSKGLEKLTGLQSLNLSSSKITDHRFLEKLTGLQSLYLSSNQITNYGFLEKLTSLQSLDLNGNHITDASFLEKLTTLQSLDLSFNKITDASFLEKLTSLQSLNLRNNQITDASFLEKVTGLQSLNLSSNQITDASFLEKLTGLQTLDLRSNQITDASFLEKLIGLQSLDLSLNQITNASFLEKLTSLQSLNLRNNQITDASFLEKLIGLQSLNLSSNKISQIASLDFIKNRAPFKISINENPFVKEHNLELRSFEDHFSSIMALLERLGSKDFTFPLKVLMLGNHGAGKSSVVDYITGKKSSGSTHILRIENHVLKPLANAAAAVPDMVFFDFGGQDFYHGLYQAFVSTGALQLIVFDSRKDKNGPDKDSAGNDIFNYDRPYWLGQKAYRERSEAPDSYVLIQTYADAIEVKEVHLPDYQQYPGYRQSFFLSFPPAKDKNVPAFYEAGRAYFKAFFEKEVKEILQTPAYAKRYAPWYSNFIEYIINKKGKSHRPVPLRAIKAHYNLAEPDEVKKLELLQAELIQLHRHGLVLYYKEKGLEDAVWLHPQALVQHVQDTILSKKIITVNTPGIVPKKEFEKLADEKTLQMLVLQKVIFLHQPDKRQPDRDEYIIPNYLPIADESNIDYQLFTFGIGKPNLIIKFNDFIPFGFINQMVCFYGQQPDAKKFWRNQLLFTLHKEVRVLIQLDFIQLKIKVHFQLLRPLQADEKLISEYLFFTLLALYWNIDAAGIPEYADYTSFKTTLANITEIHNQYPLFSQLFVDNDATYMAAETIKKQIPADAYLSIDDERYICYRDLVTLPKKEYRIKSYSLKDGRINKEDVKEIPASLFAAFTIRKLPTMKNVFISYSHDDLQYRLEMQKYLTTLKRDGLIDIWQDGMIQPGDEWDKKIKESLEKADIFIMLISQSFITSDYVHEVEFKRIMERVSIGECNIIPVLIKDCDWTNWKISLPNTDEAKSEERITYQLKDRQLVPFDHGQLLPLNQWPFPEKAWIAVAKAIRDVCEKKFIPLGEL